DRAGGEGRGRSGIRQSRRLPRAQPPPERGEALAEGVVPDPEQRGDLGAAQVGGDQQRQLPEGRRKRREERRIPAPAPRRTVAFPQRLEARLPAALPPLAAREEGGAPPQRAPDPGVGRQ